MHEGRFSLVRLFTQLAMVGAEWVMWVLVALSVFSIAIMLERGRFYWSLSDDLEALAKDLRDLLRRDDLAGARARLEKSNSPAGTIALAGLNEADRGADAAEEAMAGATARARLQLERNLAFLGTVGNNAPFVGLLGTVIGIIQAFDALKADQTAAANAARQAAANAAATAQAAAANAGALGATGRVMGTIAEALVATAIGLFVAIPAVAAFNYFQRKVRAIVASGETLSHVVLAHLRARPGSTYPVESVPVARESGAGTARRSSEELPRNSKTGSGPAAKATTTTTSAADEKKPASETAPSTDESKD